MKLRENSGMPWGCRIGLVAVVVLGALGLAQGLARGPSLPADFGHTIKATTQVAIDPTPRDTFWFIGHTHWEGAVFQTREGFLEMGLPNILTALKLLKAYPNYKFVLDQVCYVKPFLERYPEEAGAFQRFVKEGRLEIVGGIHTMHDNNIPCGESLVRQLLYGKGYYRERLGVEITVGWGLDTFGHNAQTPQILRRAGYNSFWFARGVPDPEVPSEFLWQGLDGTQIPAFWLPLSYAVLYGSPRTLPEFTRFCQERFRALERHSRGLHRVGLAGADVSEPEAHVPEMVAAFNRQSVIPFEMRIGVPTEYEAVAAQRTNRPVIHGELNPIFQGGYSSRIELKQRLRHLEHLLLTAEKLGALLQGLGVPMDQEVIWRAWEPVLFNQAHDLASGVMTDRVYEDTLRGFDFSQHLADELVASRFERLCDQIDTRGEGVPIVVFNPLGWVRTDVAEVEVGWTEPGVWGVRLTDPSGRMVPAQIVQARSYGDVGLQQARIAFLAQQVPALGYSVYRAAPLRSKAEAAADPNQGTPAGTMENEYYRMTLDLRTGAITSLVVKPGNWEALSGPGNVVACHHDGGDLWELYQNLNAGSNIGMKRQQPVPKPGQAQFSHPYAGQPGTWQTGPVFSECQASHPFTNGTIRTTVRLYAGLRRIDIRTRLLNNNLYVRYQVLFPTSIAGGQNVQEIPFGAIQRPLGIEYPAQNWSSFGDAAKGLALLNRGLPGNLVNESTLMLSLMRSARIAAYGYGGGYEPGMSSDTGLAKGQELTFDYALVAHAGDWRQAAVYRDGLEFNHPLLARKVAVHAGKLPSQWGWLASAPANVVLSAVKPGREGVTILRVYEATGQAASGIQFKFRGKIGAAFEANLIEDTLRPLALDQGAIRLDLAPFEIKTLKLQWLAAEPD
jgi:alpha-mannosidase